MPGRSVAITTAALSDRLDGYELAVITVDDPRIPGCPCTAPPMPAADDIAYIIYTSDTTGTPKGVAVPHRNVTQLMHSLEDEIEVKQVWTQCHSLSFDFSVWEIWGALLSGGRLVVVPESVTLPEDFHALLVAEHVGVLSRTPTRYALQTADTLQPELAQQLTLQTVIFGGEALQPQRLRPWLQNHPGSPRLINMYGITETTVHASFRELVDGDAESNASPIGGPLGHLAFFVLDKWLRPVPAGVVGELYVAGAGLAGGYVVGPIDGVAVPGVSVRRPRDADVSHRGSGVLGLRWAAAVCRARRRAGQDPRLSHRTRRNRQRPAGLPAGHPGRHHGAPQRRRRPPHRLPHPEARH